MPPMLLRLTIVFALSERAAIAPQNAEEAMTSGSATDAAGDIDFATACI
jgi:hypothetical protein